MAIHGPETGGLWLGKHGEPIDRIEWPFRPADLSASLVLGLLALTLIPVLTCRRESAAVPSTFFPETEEVAGWSRAGEIRTFEANKLWEYIDGDAEKYLRAGVQKTLTSDYHYKDWIEAVADVYVMAASEGARQVFESESSSGSQPAEVGEAAHLAKGTLTFRTGPYFVRLVAYQEAPEVASALVQLARGIERRLKTTGNRN